MARTKSSNKETKQVNIVQQDVNVNVDNSYSINIKKSEDNYSIYIEEPEAFIVSIDGTKGIQGERGSDGAGVGTRLVENIILPFENKEIDSFLKTDYRSVKYFITLYDEVGLNFKTLEMSLIHNNSDVKFSIYSIIGDDINISVDISMVANDIKVYIANNHSNSIISKGIKLENLI